MMSTISNLRKMVVHFLKWSSAGRNKEFKYAEFLSTYDISSGNIKRITVYYSLQLRDTLMSLHNCGF